jgi:hypothetical protein
MTRVCLNLVVTMFIAALAFGQAPGTGSTTVPQPGVGHDYIKAVSETVDPAAGSVSLRIAWSVTFFTNATGLTTSKSAGRFPSRRQAGSWHSPLVLTFTKCRTARKS